MSNNSYGLQELIQQLESKASAKRRSAAKKLRKLKTTSAGPGLMQALEKEIKNPRTWETQYHMIMALADIRYLEALPLLYKITEINTDATMIHTAVGDAITTLEFYREQKIKTLPLWIKSDKKPLAEGGFRALAMHKIVPSKELIQEIINYVEKPENENAMFWVVAASPGWPMELTSDFLKYCLKNSKLEDTKKAAKAALENKYLTWKPL
jgi:hypothetical protein